VLEIIHEKERYVKVDVFQDSHYLSFLICMRILFIEDVPRFGETGGRGLFLFIINDRQFLTSFFLIPVQPFPRWDRNLLLKALVFSYWNSS